MKICISPSHSNSLKCFLIFPCWFSLTESSFSPFKTNRILVGLQTHYKYLFMGIYRCWSCSGSSKLRLRFCMGFPWELYFIVSSKLSVFKRPKQLHRTSLILILWRIFKLQGYEVTYTIWPFSPSYRRKSLQHCQHCQRVSASASVLSALQHTEWPEAFFLHGCVLCFLALLTIPSARWAFPLLLSNISNPDSILLGFGPAVG